MNRESARKIWFLTAAGSAVALLAGGTVIRALPSPSHHIPWIALVVLFAAAEIVVVHLESRSQTHTYSLVEVPIVLGLLAVSPVTLVVSQLLGAAVTLALYRRQQPIKLAFNLCAFALETEAALLIFHGFANHRDLLAGSTIAAVFAATLMASLVGILSVFLAISVTDGTQTWSERGGALSFGLIATAVTTSTMLIGVVLQQKDASTVWLLVLPITGVYLAERAFASQIREHRKLQSLHRSAALVGGLGDSDSVDQFLQQACQILHAGVAALAYRPADDPDSLAVAVLGPAGQTRPLTLVPLTEAWPQWGALSPGRQGFVVTQEPDVAALGSLLGGLTVSDAMIVPLFGDLRVTGYLTVANRLSDVNPFSAQDIPVLETLERFVSIGLENGQLERSLEEARILERQLRHRATHDSLTGLANRSLLADHLAKTLDESLESTFAVLLIDFDNFKYVNDRYGHRTGDQVLIVAAQRLLGCLRDGDLVARIGGDELAVVGRVADDGGREAVCLGQRLVDLLAEPAAVAGMTVDVSVSIGIALGRAGDDAELLLASADSAMYRAKSAGKGRVGIGNGLESAPSGGLERELRALVSFDWQSAS